VSADALLDPPRLYRGRLAPSPTGYLHLGHARTFWIAQQRAQERGGTLILRTEDLDPDRCQPEFVAAMFEDLRWFGLQWQEGADCGGAFGPYTQSERRDFYRTTFEKLRRGGFVYPCTCSRKDVQRALQAPHQGDEEPVYPGRCRTSSKFRVSDFELEAAIANSELGTRNSKPKKINWRFRVPDGESIGFEDAGQGPQSFTAGKDFGDFIVWRHDDVPSYQLSVVVDDVAMQITEVVRGADLLISTARQILIYRALGWNPPAFYHCPLMNDESGLRLAKRHEALSLRALRQQGLSPEALKQSWQTGVHNSA
jgi:glutamyl-tRNA synthetase